MYEGLWVHVGGLSSGGLDLHQKGHAGSANSCQGIPAGSRALEGPPACAATLATGPLPASTAPPNFWEERSEENRKEWGWEMCGNKGEQKWFEINQHELITPGGNLRPVCVNVVSDLLQETKNTPKGRAEHVHRNQTVVPWWNCCLDQDLLDVGHRRTPILQEKQHF